MSTTFGGMMRKLAILCILFAGAIPVLAQSLDSPPPPGTKLIVGIHDKPPYAILRPDGHWDGLAVELWEHIANKLGYTFEFKSLPYEQLVPALQKGEVNLVIGELTVDPQTERVIDFTQPYLLSALGVAVANNHWRAGWKQVAEDIFTWDLAKICLGIVAGLFLFSFAIWMIERHQPHTHFGGKKVHGLGSALWFSAVTMTSVGYGDKTPNTVLGRFVAFVWMLIGVLIIAGFTATVASSLSIARTQNSMLTTNDIAQMKNGVLDGSPAAVVLKKIGISTVPFESLELAMKDLAAHKLDSVVSDRVSLDYEIRQNPSLRLELLPLKFFQYPVAMGVPNGSPIRDMINVELLETVATPEWKDKERFWLGPNGATDL